MISPPITATPANRTMSPQLLDLVEFDSLDDLDGDWTPPPSDVVGFDSIMDMVDEAFEATNECHNQLPSLPELRFECSTFPTSGLTNATSLKSSAQIVKRSQQKRRIPRKKQIEDLRELIAVLSLQLENIKKCSASGQREIQREIECAGSIWKSIATGQLQLRLKAEEDNTSLRKLLQLHKNAAKNMKRRFKRRIDKEYMDLPILRIPNLVSNEDHTRVFADLLRDIDELYVGVDAFYQNKTFEAVPCPGQNCQVYPDVANGVFVEFLDKNIVPFSAHIVCEAVWKSLGSRGNRDAHVLAQNYSHIGDTATSYAQYVCKVFDRATQIEEHMVIRRYINDSQTVIVSRIASTIVGDYGNLKYRETIRSIVKRGKPLASQQETAIINVHNSVARFDDGSSTAQKFRTRRFTNLAVQGWINKSSSKKQEAENYLFADTVGDCQ